MKEVIFSQALIPPGQVTSGGNILKTAHMIINTQPKSLGYSSVAEQAFTSNTHAHTYTCAYELTQASMHTHTHSSNSSSDID